VNGNAVQLWSCGSSNSDQSFSVSQVGHIKWTNHADKCLDVRDHRSKNGNHIQIWSCSDSNSDQDFEFASRSTSLQPNVAPSAAPSTLSHPTQETSNSDIIIVGAGLVGAALAARLAEKLPSKNILLLEAGRASHASLGGTDPPASWSRDHWDVWPNLQTKLTRYDVPGNYETIQCWSRNCAESWGHLTPFFQCKILGGCGVMNGALAQVPQLENFESWPLGWRTSDLMPYFEDAKSMFHITETPSGDEKHYLDEAGANFVRRAFEKAGLVHSSSLLKAAGTVSRPQVTAAHGVRQSTASQFLPGALKRANFDLRLETEVLEVIHEAGRASGVRVRTADGGSRVLRLRQGGLLVLSAGALNTPRLLMASGISAGGHVGKYLSDHPLQSLVYKAPGRPGAYAEGATEGFSLRPPRRNHILQYAGSQTGPLSQFGPTLTAFVRDPSTRGRRGVYDVEVWVNPISREGELHVSLTLMRPTCSKAELRLQGKEIKAHGRLLLACRRDRKTMEFALRQVDRWLRKQGAVQIHKGRVLDLNHFAGTCALGRCVDPKNLRVTGMSNVAVADASILPGQIWGHPALALSAVALKAADAMAASL